MAMLFLSGAATALHSVLPRALRRALIICSPPLHLPSRTANSVTTPPPIPMSQQYSIKKRFNTAPDLRKRAEDLKKRFVFYLLLAIGY